MGKNLRRDLLDAVGQLSTRHQQELSPELRSTEIDKVEVALQEEEAGHYYDITRTGWSSFTRTYENELCTRAR